MTSASRCGATSTTRPDERDGQDADWDKHGRGRDAPGLAQERGVQLKVLLTVWTPPAAMKCAVTDDVIDDGTPHPGGTKDGGALCPSQREAFADCSSRGSTSTLTWVWTSTA
jgi:hypothetical protein